jgi:hypothetical protein
MLWSSRLKSADPLSELATFKRLLSQTHHNIKHTNANNLISTYVASVRLYRILSSPNPDPDALDPLARCLRRGNSPAAEICGVNH